MIAFLDGGHVRPDLPQQPGADHGSARVRKLADETIESQEREIAEMKYLVVGLKRQD